MNCSISTGLKATVAALLCSAGLFAANGLTADPKPAAAAIDYNGTLVTYYEVADFDKALQWYQDVLGLKMTFKVAEMGWAELETATKGAMIGLSKVPKVDVTGGATAVLGVKEIDAARAALEAKGVRFDGATVVLEGMVKLATFFDLDGNKLMLSQDLSAGAPAKKQ